MARSRTLGRRRLGIALSAGLVVLLLLLSGCGPHLDFLRDPLAGAAVPPGVTPRLLGTANTPAGRLTLYEFEQNGRCSMGYLMQLSGGGGTNSSSTDELCTSRHPVVDIRGGADLLQTNQVPFDLVFGKVYDARVVRVELTVEGVEQPFEAQLVGQVWYVVTTGQTKGRTLALRGLDKAGAVVPLEPAP